MRVRATQIGFHELQRRYPGEVFDIEDELFSETWMVCLDKNIQPPPKPKPKGKPVNGKKSVRDRLNDGESVGLSELQENDVAPAHDEDVI